MSQMTKEQAAKVLVGYAAANERRICGNCRFGRQSENRDARWYTCVALKESFGLEFSVEMEGVCARFTREPL